MYSMNRAVLAQMIAAHKSGFEDANAEADDYEEADWFIRYLNAQYDIG